MRRGPWRRALSHAPSTAQRAHFTGNPARPEAWARGARGLWPVSPEHPLREVRRWVAAVAVGAPCEDGMGPW
eukprot:9020933-Pyramimonas_sp.AAC.1